MTACGRDIPGPHMNIDAPGEGTFMWRLVFVLLVSAGCSAATQHVTLDPADGSVLEGPEALETLNQCSHYGPRDASATWAPTIEQRKELEARLAGFVGTQPDRPPRDLQSYYRQYVGVVLGTRRLIYINGFPKDSIARDVATFEQFIREHPEVKFNSREFPLSMRSADGWRSHAVSVCDGGSAYWGALYDPGTHRFSEYSGNGPA